MKTPLVQAAAVAGVSLALGVLFDQFFFEKLPGLSFPIYVAGIAAGVIGLAYFLGHRLSRAVWWLLIPLIGFAGMVAIRSSASLTLMNIGACLLLILLVAKVTFRRGLTDLSAMEYVRIPFLPLQFFKPARQTLGQIAATSNKVKTKPVTRQILKGIALTLPVLIIFVVLFASADLIVQKYVSGLINFQIDDELTIRFFLIIFATLGLIGGYSYIFSSTKPEEPTQAASKAFIGKVESTILLASVNALFFAFILVQLAYLFGGQANISAQGFTYAEYARKGFFELLAVAALAFALVWSAEKYVEKTGRGHSTLFKALSTALVLQVIIIMGSAFKRLYLYEQAYGFTALRLYSHAFTVLLAVIFIILAIKIIRSASDQTFAFPALIAVIAFLATINAINPDAFIARKNLDRYQSTGKIDIHYLSRLSDDAMPVLVDEYSSLGPDEAKALGVELNRRRQSADGDWRSWNLARERTDALAGEVLE